MKIKSKVTKFCGDRKIVEIPKAARDNFELKEEVYIEKIKNHKSVKKVNKDVDNNSR